MTTPQAPREPDKSTTSAGGRVSREIAGVLMVLAGSLMLLGLIFISNDPRPLSQRLLFGLGLPGMAIASAGSQILVVAGVAVLWSALRRRR